MDVKDEYFDILLRQTVSENKTVSNLITFPQDSVASQESTVFQESTISQDSSVHQKASEYQGTTIPAKNISENLDSERREMPESNFNLLDLLNSSEEGKRLVSTYSASSDFTAEDRLTLAAIVLVHNVHPVHKRPTRQLLHILADKVIETFPTEKKEVWVADAIFPNGRAALKGTFANPVVWRMWKKMIGKGSEKNIQDYERDLIALCLGGQSKEGNNETNWEEIWQTVEHNWSNTTKLRLQKLYYTKDVFKDYFRKYTFLAEPTGFLLLEKDFEYLYPFATSNLFAEWPKLSLFFENKLKEILPNLMSDCTSPEMRMMRILTHLSWIFPILSIKKTLGVWSTSKDESQRAFLFLIKNHKYLKPYIKARVASLAQVGIKNPLPLPVVIGSTRGFRDCFVVLDTAIYKVDNPLKAIDLTFKIFHSLRLPYPPECIQIWTFLQQAVYKIFTTADRKHPKTNELISHYKKFEIYFR